MPQDTPGFAHLHLHTAASKLDGLTKPGPALAIVKADGQKAIAVSDHGNLDAQLKWARACAEAGIKHIPAEEMFVAIGSRTEHNIVWVSAEDDFDGDDASGTRLKKKTYEHLTVLARNQQGWRNLMLLDLDAHRHFWGRPRTDWDMLAAHGEGLMFGTGCLAGPVAGRLLHASSLRREAQRVSSGAPLGPFALLQWTERSDEGAPLRDEFADLLAKINKLDDPAFAAAVFGLLARADETALRANLSALLLQLAAEADAQARGNLARMVEIVGHDHVFVEVMRHDIDAEETVLPGLVALAAEFGLPVVATNDCHYAHAEDAEAHDAWLCSGQKDKDKKPRRLDDPNRWKFNGSGFWVKTAAEMQATFAGVPGCEQAVANSVRMADLVEDNIVLGAIAQTKAEHGEHRLPVFSLPEGETAESYLHKTDIAGLRTRYGNDWHVGEQGRVRKERMRLEEDTINGAGMAPYMLIVGDIMARARDMGILTGPGRGSAAGSLTAFVQGITHVDPIRYGLRFDRFLNPWRAGLPDIDMDFPDDKRDQMIALMQQVYGFDHVARIGTQGVSWGRDALAKIGRVLGMDAQARKLADAMPEGDNKVVTLNNLLLPPAPLDPGMSEAAQKKWRERADVFAMGAEMRDMVSDMGAERLVRLACQIEGTAFGESLHACGVLISDLPLPGRLPLRYDEKHDILVTQWEGGECESVGEVKFDFLAIKDLTAAAEAVRQIEKTSGEKLDLYEVYPDRYMDHPEDAVEQGRSTKAWGALGAGLTGGVFQLQADGIRSLTRQVMPTCHDHLSNICALYRPGPMGAGQPEAYVRRLRGGEDVSYRDFTDDPAEAEVIGRTLDTTAGCIIMQEQLMQLAVDIADFNPDQSSRLQKAFSKKKQDMMDELKAVWMAGGQLAARSDGTSKVAFGARTLESLWRAFEASGSYLFNKCLPGDTVVRNGKNAEWTIKQLYDRLHGDDTVPDGFCPFCGLEESKPGRRDRACPACISWRCMFFGPRGFRLLAWDPSDNRIRPQRVKDVHHNGVREVFTITLADGKSVRATDNHRFLSGEREWVHVRDMHVGMSLSVDGGYEPQDDADPSRRVTKGFRLGNPDLPLQRHGGTIDGGWSKLQHWTARHPVEQAVCACGRTLADGRRERAHLDGDRTNNEDSNLEWKCVSCHKAYDHRTNGRRRQWDKGYRMGSSEIVSIERSGIEEVYDVEMEAGTSHSFIANGVVSHNSHSYTYADISWWTVYLKANWPAEFAAGLLYSTDDEDKRARVMTELAAEGVVFLPPDVNLSEMEATVHDGKVVLGIGGVRGIKSAGQGVVDARGNRPYTSLTDVVHRSGCTTLVTQALAEAGAFDGLGLPRLGAVMASRAGREGAGVPRVEWGILERARRQRERMGLVVGEHPMQVLRPEILRLRSEGLLLGQQLLDPSVVERTFRENGQTQWRATMAVIGVVAKVEHINKGRGHHCAVQLESHLGRVDTVMWSRYHEPWARSNEPVMPGELVIAIGQVRSKVLSVDEQGNETIEVSLQTTDMQRVPVNDPWTLLPWAAPQIVRDESPSAPVQHVESVPVAEHFAPVAEPVALFAPTPAPAPVAPITPELAPVTDLVHAVILPCEEPGSGLPLWPYVNTILRNCLSPDRHRDMRSWYDTARCGESFRAEMPELGAVLVLTVGEAEDLAALLGCDQEWGKRRDRLVEAAKKQRKNRPKLPSQRAAG